MRGAAIALAALLLPGCTPLILAVAHATAEPERADEDVHDNAPAEASSPTTAAGAETAR